MTCGAQCELREGDAKDFGAERVLASLLYSEAVSKLRLAVSAQVSGVLLVGCDVKSLHEVANLAALDAPVRSCLSVTAGLPLEVPDAPVVCVHDLQEDSAHASLAAILDSGKATTVLATASSMANIGPSLLRAGRLDCVIRLKAPTQPARKAAWKWLVQELIGVDAARTSGFEDQLADVSPSFVLGDFCRAAYLFSARANVLRHDSPIEGGITFDAKRQLLLDIVAASRPRVRAEGMDFALSGEPDGSYSAQRVAADNEWRGIGGYNAQKEQLLKLCEWPILHKNTFAGLGVRPPRGVLLSGPSGCGKTMMATALLKRLVHAAWVHVNGPDLYSKYLGDSEARVRALFEHARALEPCVLLIDELDALAADRRAGLDDGGTGVERRVLGALLAELDGAADCSVFLLGCTSAHHRIDPALIRPGRIDNVIELGLPGFEDRLDILRVLTRDTPISSLNYAGSELEVRSTVLANLAQCTSGLTGADLSGICRKAALLAMREKENPLYIMEQHLFKACSKWVYRSGRSTGNVSSHS